MSNTSDLSGLKTCNGTHEATCYFCQQPLDYQAHEHQHDRLPKDQATGLLTNPCCNQCSHLLDTRPLNEWPPARLIDQVDALRLLGGKAPQARLILAKLGRLCIEAARNHQKKIDAVAASRKAVPFE